MHNVCGRSRYNIVTVTLHVMSFDKSDQKIDLKSIIESETPTIDSEFLDRFRTLKQYII